MKRSSRDTPYKIVFLVVSVPQTHALWRLILSEPQKIHKFLMYVSTYRAASLSLVQWINTEYYLLLNNYSF